MTGPRSQRRHLAEPGGQAGGLLRFQNVAGLGSLASGMAGPGTVCVSLCSLSALVPRGLQCEHSLGFGKGCWKLYLHPVHGDGGAEVSPRKRGCWPCKARRDPPTARPLFLAAVHPRAPLGCVGVPAGYEAVLKLPAEGPALTTPPPLETPGSWSAASASGTGEGPCREHRASRGSCND